MLLFIETSWATSIIYALPNKDKYSEAKLSVQWENRQNWCKGGTGMIPYLSNNKRKTA